MSSTQTFESNMLSVIMVDRYCLDLREIKGIIVGAVPKERETRNLARVPDSYEPGTRRGSDSCVLRNREPAWISRPRRSREREPEPDTPRS